MPPEPKVSKQLFYCPYCDVVVSWKDSLKRHILSKHSNNAVDYTCLFCNNKYSSKDSLKRHMKMKHPEEASLVAFASKVSGKKGVKRKKAEFTVVHGKDGSVHKRKRRSEWTTEEKALFVQLLDIHKRDWNAIADRLGTKTASQVRAHAYARIRKHPTNSGSQNWRKMDEDRAAAEQDGVKFSYSGKSVSI